MTGHDETEAQKYREQLDRLLQEKEELELLLRFVNDGIILVDLKGDVIYANRIALNAFDFSQELEDGFSISTADKAVRDDLRKSIQDILMRAKTPGTLELGRNGKYRFYKVRVRVYMPNVKELGIFITLRDVTREHEIIAMKDNFLDSAAHDIKGPFLGMQKYLEKLESACSKMPGEMEYISALRRSGDRLFGLMQDILNVARMGVDKVKLKTGDKPLLQREPTKKASKR